MNGTQREIPAAFATAVLVLAAARAALEAGVVQPPEKAAPAGIAWLAPEEAAERARATGQPLLIDFSADWCAPCARLERESLVDPAVLDVLARGFVATRVVDARDPSRSTPGGDALRERFGVTAFPTLVVVLPGDAPPVIHVGFALPGDLRRFLDLARLRALAARNAEARRARVGAR